MPTVWENAATKDTTLSSTGAGSFTPRALLGVQAQHHTCVWHQVIATRSTEVGKALGKGGWFTVVFIFLFYFGATLEMLRAYSGSGMRDHFWGRLDSRNQTLIGHWEASALPPTLSYLSDHVFSSWLMTSRVSSIIYWPYLLFGGMIYQIFCQFVLCKFFICLGYELLRCMVSKYLLRM